MNKGLFISLEGIEATGKTTISLMLKNKLKEKNKKALITREPGGIESSEEIRDVIMSNEIYGETELLLFLAARREHLYKKIIPSLNEYDYIICDRFAHSSIAYQGKGHGIGMDKVYELNNFATNGVLPDITFLIDIPVELSLKRKSKVDDQNRLDHMSFSFYEDVREGFRQMVGNPKYGNVVLIDGQKTKNEIVEEMIEYITTFKRRNK